MTDPVAILRERLGERGTAWLVDAEAAVRDDPAALRTSFPAAGRWVGRALLDEDPTLPWTADDAARLALLRAAGPAAVDELADLYRHGDAAEQRAVLRALDHLDVGEAGVPLVHDALRTNDARLVAAALGTYGVAHLDDAALRQAVLKCVFVGLPLGRIPGLPERADAELSRMLAAYALERVAAGRDVPADIWPLVDQHPPTEVLAAIDAERRSEHADRRGAAEAALRDRAAAAGRDAPGSAPSDDPTTSQE
jgi:hypothetical protein